MTINGSSDECIAHFVQHSSPEMLALIETFTDVTPDTVRRWKNGQHLPKGEALLRLRCFLTLVGYKIDEFEELPAIAQQLGFLIASKQVSIDAAMLEMGYKNQSGIYDLVLRGRSPLPDRVFRMERLIENNKELLCETVNSWVAKIEQVLGPEAVTLPAGILDVKVSAMVAYAPAQSPIQSSPSSKRTRKRAQRVRSNSDAPSYEANDLATAKILMHLVQGMATVLSTSSSGTRKRIARHLSKRVSPHQLESLRDFLGDVIEYKQ